MFVARSIALFSDVINNRLYERVREKGGLVYSVDMSFDPMFYADAGFFTVIYVCVCVLMCVCVCMCVCVYVCGLVV